MAKNKDRIIFALIGGLIMLLFNVRYCQEVQTAERANFNGWVGSLSPRSLPSDLKIEYRAGDSTTFFVAKDDNSKAKVLRLVQVLRESGIVGRLGSSRAQRAVIVHAGPRLEYVGGFSEEEARQSPPLQVFARLISEFAPPAPPEVASEPESR